LKDTLKRIIEGQIKEGLIEGHIKKTNWRTY